ncbi:hypothetical protein ACIP9H_33895 [Streptomyces sp. NPDC088732]|uniref:hypothetical protein n=1 Tax=Streptomyces sp. NPDC088732 TaxID=3365879 RepID=UPI003801A546
MSEAQFAVIVTRPGHDTVRIGPFDFRHQAEHATWDFRSQLRNTTHPDGTTIDFGPYDESLPHTSRTPRDAMELALLMDSEPDGDGTGSNFPDLFSRLHAEAGYEEAARLWKNACSLYDSLQAEDVEV